MTDESIFLLPQVLDAINGLAVIADSQGRVVAFNRACEVATGYRRDEVIGQDLLAALVPDAWFEEVRRRIADPYAAAVREPHENPWKTKVGGERLIQWRCTPLDVPGYGAPFILGIGCDVTERVALGNQLQVQLRLIDRFFESTLACVVLLDRDFNFLRVSQAYAHACRRDISEFVGRNHFEMYPSDSQAIFEEVVSSGKPYAAHARPFEFPDLPELGVTYWDWTLAPIHGEDGEVELLIFCLNDVTKWWRTEERLQQEIIRSEGLARRLESTREREQRRLARELHDEMGQELTALRLALDNLTDSAQEGDISRLAAARAIVHRLQARVRSISADLSPLMLEDFGLPSALTWLADRQKVLTGLDVTIRHSGLDRRLSAEYETTLYRIVQESLTNVVRHAQVLRADVLLCVTSEAIVVKVEDAGAGFDAERQMEPARTTGGTGLLGMRERARALGGRLVIESSPGTGTAITVELPLTERLVPS